jgi:hypothetical protein
MTFHFGSYLLATDAAVDIKKKSMVREIWFGWIAIHGVEIFAQFEGFSALSSRMEIYSDVAAITLNERNGQKATDQFLCIIERFSPDAIKIIGCLHAVFLIHGMATAGIPAFAQDVAFS